MHALLVGAGAVGQVYGRHLQRGGAQVSFLVKPRHAAEARAGFTMADLNAGGRLERFEGYRVWVSPDELRGQRFDQVWLCVSSPALRGDWLGPTLAAAGQATGGVDVVSFQPGLRDPQLLGAHVAPDRLVKGLIAFSSWHAPLPGAPAGPAHTAYWSPPLSPSLFEGPGADQIAGTLRRGGLPARVGPALATTARGSAFLLPTVAATECAGWSFASLRRGPWAGMAARASRQAMAISCAHLGLGVGPMGLLAHPLGVAAFTTAASLVAPFDFERFFQVHFEKVGEQTMTALDGWIAEGRARELPTGELEALRQALRERRGQGAA
ncbi:2-dehydropantoate 2-reductase [Myxococcota bacterium]|nr:2-dehydropantoate 2-reductase [Myxococcota bacterium]